ncbi:MAG TPA: putative glycolipid-binding domain-containing protein [Chloroflexota bacterium]|nr:putative glycolipid-binding domain-containing protein [Chloroflexota bacterium]
MAVAWTGVPYPGVEFVEVTFEADRLRAAGVAVRAAPLLYRLDYQLETTAGFVTSALHVDVHGQGWRRRLEIRRSPSGTWTARTAASGDVDLPAPGGDLSGLVTALDCDLGLSPLTNTMPVLRRDLLDGAGTVEFLMAWVAVPELTVSPQRQRYISMPPAPAGRVVRFESVDDDFVADLTFDEHGLVVDYPQIAHRFTAGLDASSPGGQ